MGTIRNGSRGALNAVQKACKLSRLPGWRTGIMSILGPTAGPEFLAVWDPFCAVVDLLVGADNFFNQIDYQDEAPTDDEDFTAI